MADSSKRPADPQTEQPKKRSRWNVAPEAPPLDPSVMKIEAEQASTVQLAQSSAALAIARAKQMIEERKKAAIGRGAAPPERPQIANLATLKVNQSMGRQPPGKPQAANTMAARLAQEGARGKGKGKGKGKGAGKGAGAYVDPSLVLTGRGKRREIGGFVEGVQPSMVKAEEGSPKNVFRRDRGEREELKRDREEAMTRAVEELLASKNVIKKEEDKNGKVKTEGGARDIDVPEVEWWDELVLVPDSKDQIDLSQVTNLVEHPVPIEPNERAFGEQLPSLTPKERRKLRRLRKKERTREYHDKIRMGLVRPPPPKVKMKNLMLVLGDEAVSNPTAVEKKVKAQIAQRLKEHEQRNEARKKPAEEKRAATVDKWKKPEETSVAISVAVFKVKRLSDKRHQYKVSKNAEQLHLTGTCLLASKGMSRAEGGGSLVVVEGSAKAVKKYVALMCRRIKWERTLGKEDGKEKKEEDEGAMEDQDDDEEAIQERSRLCTLLWQGTQPKRLFPTKLALHTVSSEAQALRRLSFNNAEHFWDMMSRHRDVEEDL